MSLPRLRDNILALSVVQAGNYLVPLLALPYLARVLGSHAYGEVVFVQTVMMFCMLLVDFGFIVSATRDIAASRDDREKLSALFAGIWGLQWLLFAVVIFILIILILCLPALRQNAALYVVGLGMVFGQVLFPLWLFQGLEALKAAAAIQVVGKVLALPSLLIWVHGPLDQVAALMFFSASSVISGLLALWWMNRSKWIAWGWPSNKNLFDAFRQGRLIFGSRVSISLYSTTVPLALGLWADSSQLATYNLADRVRVALQALLIPVSQALYPRMSYLIQTNRAEANVLLLRSAKFIGLVSLIACSVVWFFADEIMLTIGGSDFKETGNILRWLAFVPLVVACSNMIGIQVMLPRGMNRSYTAIHTIVSLVCIAVLYPFVTKAGALGAVQLVLVLECLVALFMLLYILRNSSSLDV
jgi:O-antigen/teichoic acid export membrane protein